MKIQKNKYFLADEKKTNEEIDVYLCNKFPLGYWATVKDGGTLNDFETRVKKEEKKHD